MAIAGGVASALSLIVAAQTVNWDGVLPMTKAAHAEHVEAVLGQFVAAQDAAVEAVSKFEMRWICDEWAEELADLLLIAEDDLTPRDEERIIRLRERIDENDCHRFED